MQDVKSRLAGRAQITSDGLKAYVEAVEGAFGSDVDYAQLVKIYGDTSDGQKRYSPSECVGARKEVIRGKPVSISASPVLVLTNCKAIRETIPPVSPTKILYRRRQPSRLPSWAMFIVDNGASSKTANLNR